MRKSVFLQSLLLSVSLLFFSGRKESSSGVNTRQERRKDETVSLPEQSVYQLTDTFITQRGKPFVLRELQSKPVLISMIFTSCQYACPKMTNSIIDIENSLHASQRDKVRYVLVSFDSDTDSPEKLDAFAKEHNLDDNWILLHGTKAAVANLSVLLDIKYEQTGPASFQHANKKMLLDKEGSIVYSEEGLDNADDKITGALKKLIEL